MQCDYYWYEIKIYFQSLLADLQTWFIELLKSLLFNPYTIFTGVCIIVGVFVIRSAPSMAQNMATPAEIRARLTAPPALPALNAPNAPNAPIAPNAPNAPVAPAPQVASSKPRVVVPAYVGPPLFPNLAFQDRMDYRNQVEWLKRSTAWPDIPNEWRPRRLLGAGAYGIVALFEYIGKNPKMPTHMVVKQSAGPIHRRALRWESYFLKQCAKTFTNHVVRIYKGYYE